MNKFTLTLAAALVCCGAQAGLVKAPAYTTTRPTSAVTDQQPQKLTFEQRQQMQKAARNHAPVVKAVAGPGTDDKVLDQPGEGKQYTMLKSGMSYGYNWLMGLFTQPVYNGLNHVVFSSDGKHVYIQNPIYFNYASEENWIVGDVNGDEVTFTFPQLIDEEIYTDDDGNVEEAYYDYALVLEFVVEDEETQEGWYYPRENQTYKFKIEDDGALTSLEGEDVMLGMCNYFDGEDLDEGEEPHWSWQGNGDFITAFKHNNYQPVITPNGLQFNEWQLIDGISSRPVGVAFYGDDIYINSLFPRMEDAVVKGKVEGDKVTFNNAQVFGEYWNGGSMAFFLTGTVSTETDEYGDYKVFNIGDNLVFNFDKDKNILSTDGGYCVSSAPDKVLYYLMADKPYICIPPADFTVKKLLTPELAVFYDVDEEYGWEAEFYFDLPTIDADKNILPTDRLGYQVIMDDEVFTFYSDEYELPEGVEETTIIPYGYSTEESYDFSATGVEHGFTFHSVGFKSLGVREVYTDADGNNIFSDILWAPNYVGNDGVDKTFVEKTVKAKTYYNLNGVRVNNPEKGVYIQRVTFDDGSAVTRKVVVK